MMRYGTILAALLICAAIPAFAQRQAAPAGPSNPFQGNEQAIADGKSLYDQNCTACHGPDGRAGEIGPAIVLSSATTLRGQLSEAQILNIIRSGVPGTAMPAWKGRLSDDDILKIGAYIHSLRGTAIDNPLPGNVAHGESVFWGKGGCGSCHMIRGRGGVIGPDLTNIANIRKAPSIVDALTKAQHHVYGDGGVHLTELPPMDTYNPVHVVLADGRTVDGVLLNQDTYSLQIMGMDSKLHLLDRAKLREVDVKPGTIMPTDYDKRLTADEFKDLLAFLTRQGTPMSAGPAK